MIDNSKSIENDDSMQETSKKRYVKYLFNFAIFFALIYLTFRILLKDQNMDELANTITSAKLHYILLGVLCMIVFYVCESFNMRRTLRALGEKCNMLTAIKYTLIGAFFSAITPAASGGQPMQIFFMHRDGIKVSSSTISLLLNLMSFQTITIVLELVSACFLHEYMDAGVKIIFVIGVILNFSSLVLIIVGMTSKKLSNALVKFVAKVLKFFKVKNYEKKEQSMNEALEMYNESAKYIRGNKTILFKQFSVGIFQQIVYYSIPFFVVLALGLPRQSYILTVALQSMVFGSVSGIPSPGAVGVSEGAFVEIFRNIYPEHMIKSATLLNRGINFYIFMLISGIIVTVNQIKEKKNGEII